MKMTLLKWPLLGCIAGIALSCTPPEDVEPSEEEGAAEDGTTGSPTPSGEESTETSSSTGSDNVDTSGGESDYDPNEDIPPFDEEGCHALYAQDTLPTFEIIVHDEIWEQLMWEWNNGPANELAEIETKPYHSLVEFRYEDIVITDAAIRLRGNPTYWGPLPDEDKMQFQIGFHRQDPDGHFLGIKRLVLDAHTYNRHMLRDRLALMVMRDVGIRAPCANNARLVVNGEYYGIFTNIEKLDEVFLERTMEDPSGDLWKRANWNLKTNKDTATDIRVDALRAASDVAELGDLLDIEQALLTYAAEAVLPNSDGAWAGGLNWYLYDDPERGKFMLLPWDLDNTFEYFYEHSMAEYPDNPDPFTWEKPTTHGRPFYDIALQDPEYFALYIDAVDRVLHEGYDVDMMLARVDEMSAQIEQAVLEDPNKPYDNDRYVKRLNDLREYIPLRYAYVDQWLECWQGGGVDDGSGHCVMQ